jgi:hypothetical protein
MSGDSWSLVKKHELYSLTWIQWPVKKKEKFYSTFVVTWLRRFYDGQKEREESIQTVTVTNSAAYASSKIKKLRNTYICYLHGVGMMAPLRSNSAVSPPQGGKYAGRAVASPVALWRGESKLNLRSFDSENGEWTIPKNEQVVRFYFWSDSAQGIHWQWRSSQELESEQIYW